LLPELKAMAAQLGIPGASGMRKGDLVAAIAQRQGGNGDIAEQPPLFQDFRHEPAETEGLFARHPTVSDLAGLPLEVLEREIQSTGFFRNKAKNIQACCQQLLREHGGEVPRDLDKLVKLPGVGRKTANVVLGTFFGLATGVVVDTHVSRLSQRLGLTRETQPEKIEADLMQLLPQDEWIMFSHRMIHHGRQVCQARKPNCEGCAMREFCPQVGVEQPTVRKRSSQESRR